MMPGKPGRGVSQPVVVQISVGEGGYHSGRNVQGAAGCLLHCYAISGLLKWSISCPRARHPTTVSSIYIQQSSCSEGDWNCTTA